jgi:hypothetical protein
LIQKASNTQKRASYENSSGILTNVALMQALIKKEASHPQQEVHLILSGSHLYG